MICDIENFAINQNYYWDISSYFYGSVSVKRFDFFLNSKINRGISNFNVGKFILKVGNSYIKVRNSQIKVEKSNGYVGNFNFKVGIQKQITMWH